VLVAIAESPAEYRDAYRSWFDAILASLEIQDSSTPRADRDYSSGAEVPDPPPQGSP
jgi:hypothetical protein